MNLKIRLTLFSSLVFTIIFGLATLVIYWIFYNSSERHLISSLEKNAKIAGIYYLEADEQSPLKHLESKNQYESLVKRAMVAVYNAEGRVSYGGLKYDNQISKSLLTQLKSQKTVYFKTEDSFYFGLYYPDNQGDFFVFVKESNTDFNQQLNRLLFILVLVFLVALISIVLLSLWLSKYAYLPIRNVIQEIQHKDLNTIQEPLTVIKTKDELQDLIESYNALLRRISENMIIRKNFVSYVSHEFRTPLAGILGSMEVFGTKARSQEEYQELAATITEHVNFLNHLIGNFLLLTEDQALKRSMEVFRIDEVVWDLVPKFARTFTVPLKIELEVDEPRYFNFRGNRMLLALSISNLIENALKYANGQEVLVRMTTADERLSLQIIDQGIGIPQAELEAVKQTFYRATNVGKVKGSGIGLSFAQIVFKDQGVDFAIHSNDLGTTVSLLFPKF
ncbi:HAMP domain-containing histidine kinase [Sphingobacterium sp. ML3W]|uniref:sensor histidine kinase n=1 Tax=Sphingobacterium sp. ML3W TaxID=1538644 RepID=UPI00249C8B2F|nr:HAMP domain-containing sensor histidine kinase [Sphingobacterium sp. ML3W]WFA79578.1 HAMP domain-containing histidine kinase [Sphingobacterium sp. ML3W]